MTGLRILEPDRELLASRVRRRDVLGGLIHEYKRSMTRIRVFGARQRVRGRTFDVQPSSLLITTRDTKGFAS
jgi:hypothetical protein